MANREDLSSIAGPQNMSKPSAQGNNGSIHTPSNGQAPVPAKKKKNRSGKKKRNRRQSFAAPSETTETAAEDGMRTERPSILNLPDPRSSTQQASLYRIRQGNRSNTSLESEALLDHRYHDIPRSRRKSNDQRQSMPFQRAQRGWDNHNTASSPSGGRSRLSRAANVHRDDEDDFDATDRTPLLTQHANRSKPELTRNESWQNYGSHKTRRSSAHSKTSPHIRPNSQRDKAEDEDYDVNNPPSMPNSPKLGSLDDLMIGDITRSDPERERDALISIDDDNENDDEENWRMGTSPEMRRRPTAADLAERDVCFPHDDHLTEIGEDDRRSRASSSHIRRKRSRRWPDLDILDQWSVEEKEERTAQEVLRVKKISEPLVVGGRLRPKKAIWHAEEDDLPFRFTYFNETLDGTIHARTISDLCQDGATFKDLFLPNPVELSDVSEDDEDQDDNALQRHAHHRMHSEHRDESVAPSESNTLSKLPTRVHETSLRSPPGSRAPTESNTPELRESQAATPRLGRRPKRYGPRPTFWLDVLKPTEIEMKVLSKAFGIHQLTTEDILMEEPREKVELFQSYYFISFRSFEQDKDSPEYMEPVNMYVVVFREGVISFHHSMTPHPANVRRRIRQLNDYMSPTADWISYGLIDDVTDAYAPLVQLIEDEVDMIDDEILYMHDNAAEKDKAKANNKNKEKSQADAGASKTDEKTAGDQGGDMLRRVGETRKKVMSLYRLLGTKADVIKGFAKRCNEHWEVAPRSEIGLYLGDIQDHIVTMTGNLSHYEK